jgi:hypothetical protein
LGLKTGAGAQCGWAAQEGFQVWASKPGVASGAAGRPGFLVWTTKPGVAPGAVGRPGGFGSLGLKTTQVAGFSVWASKPRMALDAVEWPGGFGDLASKSPRRPVSWFGPQNQDPRGLARLSGLRNVPRHVAEWFGWFGPQNHQGGGFPGFGLKTGGGVWRCLGRREGRVDGSRTLRGVEARCAKDSRPSDRKRNENGLKRPCVGDSSQNGEGHLCKINMGCLRS